MEILGFLLIVGLLVLLGGVVRSRRRAARRGDLTDLRSAADTVAALVVGGAIIHGLYAGASGDGNATPTDISPPIDFGGGSVF